MFGHARFRRRAAKHPSPRQAFDALELGQCMYAPLGTCSGGVASVGLRSNEDGNAVLVCRAHFGRLRQIDKRSLDRLERALLQAFVRPPAPAPERDEGPTLVHVRSRAS